MKKNKLALKAELQRTQSEGYEVMFFNQFEKTDGKCIIYKMKDAIAIVDKKDDIPVVTYFCKHIDDEDTEGMEFVMECDYSEVQYNLRDFNSEYVSI